LSREKLAVVVNQLARRVLDDGRAIRQEVIPVSLPVTRL
jgi:hypothetical protein